MTSAVELRRADGSEVALVLQRRRGGGLAPGSDVDVEAALLRAARRTGVPVPGVVAAGGADGLDPGWLVVERLDGETIPRRLLRDETYAAARAGLTVGAARALARIHTLDPDTVEGLPAADPLRRPLELLDVTDEVRPVLELGARWLASHRPVATGRTVVHGDFRMGNLLVDPAGLVGVLDWELAHAGDPAEDIGWLSAPAWRFGGPGAVGGFGSLGGFLAAYADAGGAAVDPGTVRWWQVYATLKWAVICALQAAAHLSGAVRSVELAAIGRRVCESEWDLLGLLGVDRSAVDDTVPPPVPARAPFGRPDVGELVAAVEGYLRDRVQEGTEGAARFDARVAANVLAVVGRELALGPSAEASHRRRLAQLGFADDAALAAAIRGGGFDDRLDEVGAVLSASVADELRVASPGHLIGS